MVLCNLQNDYRFFKTLLRRAKRIRTSRGVFQDSGCFTVSQKSKHSIRGISSIKITKRFHVGFCPFLLINFIAFMNKLSIKNHDKLFEFIQRNHQKTLTKVMNVSRDFPRFLYIIVQHRLRSLFLIRMNRYQRLTRRK